MCVIVAKKTRLKSTNKDSWFLYKIRDRAYSPNYRIKFTRENNIEAVYLIDEDSDWTEGLNSAGIMIVSAALQNHEDKKDGVNKTKKEGKRTVTRNGMILRQAMRQSKIEDVLKIFKEELFTGTTYISDGDRLFVLEIHIKNEAIEREQKNVTLNKKIKNMDSSEIRSMAMKNIKPDDYGVEVKEIKRDKLIVRTNHGRLIPEAGYQPKDGEGYESSQKRYQYAYDAVEAIGDNPHPFEVITTLKNLKEVDKIAMNNPIRPKDAEDCPYYSSTVIMLTPTGSMFCVPLYSEFEDVDFNDLYGKDREVHFTLLPKRLPLFEGDKSASSFSDMIFGEMF